jgi:uncharacterized membrane protein
MAQTATRKRASGGSSSKRASAKSNGSGPKKDAKKSVKKEAAKEALTTRPGGPVRLKVAATAVKTAVQKVGARAKETLPALTEGSAALAERIRPVPVQCSLDVAVPLEAAWDEWMRFDWMPDGAHRVVDVERDGDVLFGQLSGPRISRDWEAEITDERTDQSFAWQTVEGSDTSGLVTFHRLSDRLTRLELQLDIVPEGPSEALSLVLRRADRRAENALRGFKAQVEALDPDEYPDVADEVEDDYEPDTEDEDIEDEDIEDDESDDAEA